MSRFNCIKSQRSNRRGLTLLELVVVLGILALLAGVAVQSLDPIANQSRYESSQNMIDGIRSATIGDQNAKNANGQKIISGYVADTALLPSALTDLLQKPNAIVAYGTNSFDSDRDLTNDVTLARGWNGPYLQLGAGRTNILDGWGHALTLQNNSGAITIASLGSDNDSIAPEDGYQTDISVEIPVNAYSGDVIFRLYAISAATGTRIDPTQSNLLDGIASPPAGTKLLGVHFYGKNASGGTNGEIQELMCPVAMSGSFEYRISNALHGKAAARAVFWVDANDDELLSPGEVVLRKSCVQVFDIVAGQENRFDMELR
jgi:prepilin-type N-terminal cleavage/methylation domain-containing protein